MDKYPGQFHPGQLRTLQRRMRDFRALHGPDKEVFFEQQHVPGREGAFDFTHATELGVTIAGQPFPHLLFEFVLCFSGWLFVMLARSETYEALAAGIQQALWTLGGVPEVLRSDNLSAATHQLRKTPGRALNARYRALLDHYGLHSSRIRPGQSHENGSVEQRHNRIKKALAQALLLRGSSDFPSLEDYKAFVQDIVARHNHACAQALDQERPLLRPLPTSPIADYTSVWVAVRKWSTLRVRGKTYSVPSRLIGHRVLVRLHPESLEVFYRDQRVCTMPRLVGSKDHLIDYRHIIWSLVRKPGAFARYRYREELFPTLVFRRAYDALVTHRGERADIEYVRILHLAASTLESSVERALSELLESGQAFDYARVKALVAPHPTALPTVGIPAPDLTVYDRLLQGAIR
jgi:transposase InsO family protein